MECKSVKISEFSLNKIRDFGKEFGEPTDDTALRHLFSEYEKQQLEIELLKNELADCKRKKGSK